MTVQSVPKSIEQALAAARGRIDDLDARLLLGYVTRRGAAYLIAHAEDALDPEQGRAFDALVARRAAGEPVAYITGRREFFGLDFHVTPAVLIPRPETELLVELALARIPEKTACDVLDLGTGSGCVAISIARHRHQARVVAIDRSPEALVLARENTRALAVGNVELAAGEWFEAVAGRSFDLIVANPPYVAAGDPHLAQGDLRFEPALALCGGRDGLESIRAIVKGAGQRLRPSGWLLFEHGYDQAAVCRALLQAAGYGAVASWRDLAGHERVSGGRKLDGVAG